jgi:hypothetical protein
MRDFPNRELGIFPIYEVVPRHERIPLDLAEVFNPYRRIGQPLFAGSAGSAR